MEDHCYRDYCSTAVRLDQHCRGGVCGMCDSMSCLHLNVVMEKDIYLSSQGFGHLVPSTEPSKVLGVLYESCIFDGHNGKDRKSTRITVNWTCSIFVMHLHIHLYFTSAQSA